MNEKEILEYRKRSAERLDATIYNELADFGGEKMFKITNNPEYKYPIWQPDKDANQMLMVKNHVNEQGIDIIIVSAWTWNHKSDPAKWELYYSCSFDERHNGNNLVYFSNLKSELIAFAKAFLEYEKQQ